MLLKDRFVEYLDHYKNKNIGKVSEMFADNILLRDWKISVSGKEQAIAETEKNFRSAKTIEIEILHTCESENVVSGELRIVVDEAEVLYVVDVITFNQSGEIVSIRAYQGRSD